MTIDIRLAALGALLLLGACATQTAQERAATCASTDWLQAGITDGQFGVPASARADLFAECTERGAPVNVALYRRGHEQGLLDYCTEDQGYEWGYEGRTYRNVCPAGLEPDFLAGYERGEEARPSLQLRPTFGIGVGIGPGGVRPNIGIGLSGGCWFWC